MTRLSSVIAALCLVGCGSRPSSEDSPRASVADVGPVQPEQHDSGAGAPATKARTAAEAAGPPGPAEDRATLAVGGEFTCALHEDAVYCWGKNDRGQLGVGSLRRRRGPAKVRGLEAATLVAAGESHACAATASGGVLCWGEARGPAEGRRLFGPTPTAIAGVEEVVGLAAGGGSTCARSRSGEVACLGPEGEIEVQQLPAPAAAVGVGASHVCARLVNGAMRCWGMNFFGQLGVTEPHASEGAHEQTGVSAVARIAVGNGHSCALREGGELWCWGDHRPDRRHDQSIAPPQLRARDVARVAAGGLHTCTFSTDGSTLCREVFQGRVWPGGARGRARSPAVRLPEGTTEVALGEGHRCVRLGSGAVMCWGNNGSGECGTGGDYLPVPTEVPLPR